MGLLRNLGSDSSVQGLVSGGVNTLRHTPGFRGLQGSEFPGLGDCPGG